MPGFILALCGTEFPFPLEKRRKLLVNDICGQGFHIQRRVVDKFLDDRLFNEDDRYIAVTEGVILNKSELIEDYAPGESFAQCVKVMYEKLGDRFYSEFRGSFSGAFYDKSLSKWIVFTDHIGDKQIFYAEIPGGCVFASEIGFIVDALHLNGIATVPDKIGCYMALTHGFCYEDKTLVAGVYKLIAGHYAEYTEENGLKVIRYHHFFNKPDNSMSASDAIEGIEKLFRQAVKRQFDKDREYGYRHLACLSGGLDSRMTVWVAHEMGYTDQLNITYSQSNYLDFTIAQQIATDLHHDFLFKPLDGGDCIKLIDDISSITYGSANFFGLAHGKSMEDLINYDSFGIIHTGQIGDSVIGTFFKKNEYNPQVKFGQGAYSVELIERLADYSLTQDYENEEIFCLYSRAFSGADQGLLTFQENSESCSPFTDVDFLEFCYSIPINLRFNHKIYFDWILQKHPDAAKYVWEKTRSIIKPFENRPPKTMTVRGYTVPHFTDPSFLPYLKGFVLRRLGLKKKGQKACTITIKSADNMNPVDYWYDTNPAFRHFIEDYWHKNKNEIKDYELAEDMRHLIEDCVVYDKLQCLSVLSAIKLINGSYI